MQGHTDIALNEVGIRQAQDVARSVGALPIKTICVSPLSRARRTAEIININNVPVIVIEELKECGFGIHEGEDSRGPWRTGWLAGGAIEGGERRTDYITRVQGALRLALAHAAPVLVVAHGGTFWGLEELLGETMHPQNCILYEIMPPADGQKNWTAAQRAYPSQGALTAGQSIG